MIIFSLSQMPSVPTGKIVVGPTNCIPFITKYKLNVNTTATLTIIVETFRSDKTNQPV